jgi:hypothetical protein
MPLLDDNGDRRLCDEYDNLILHRAIAILAANAKRYCQVNSQAQPSPHEDFFASDAVNVSIP